MASGGSLSLRRRSRPLINLNGIPFLVCTSSSTFLPSVPLILHSDKSSILQKVVFFYKKDLLGFCFSYIYRLERGERGVVGRVEARISEERKEWASDRAVLSTSLYFFKDIHIFCGWREGFPRNLFPTFVFWSPLRSGGWMTSICESSNVTVTDHGRDAECLALNWREKRWQFSLWFDAELTRTVMMTNTFFFTQLLVIL